MSVFRIEKNKNYTVMSNHHLRDNELSLKAKGLLSQMLSLPENWDYTLAGLSRINKESIGAIRTAVWELEKAGYITRRQGRDSKGKMTAIEYTIYEQPQPMTSPPTSDNPILENPLSENPITDKSTLEIPTSENSTQLNKDKTNKEKLNTDLIKYPSINQREQAQKIRWIDKYNKNAERIKNNIEYDTLVYSYDKAVKKVMAEQVVLTGLNYTSTYGEAELLLNKYNNILNIDLSKKLTGIKDPTNVYKGLFGNYYKSAQTLSNEIDALAAKQKKAEEKVTENNNSSSGSSGGGGFIGVPATREPLSTDITPAENTGSGNTNTDNKIVFNDLKEAEWARAAVEYLVDKGALQGYETGEFRPNDNVTREQFVKTVVTAFNIKDGEEPGFLDVDRSAWYYDSICIAYKNKIVMGMDDTKFGIGNTLTREEMAVFAYRAAKVMGYEFKESSELIFSDKNDISEYAKEAVSVMNDNGFINGFPDGTFAPKGECTRAQMAVVLAAICQSVK